MPRPASTASTMISRELNQSLSWPRSSIICSAPIPSDSTAKPSQSKRSRRCPRGFGRNASSPAVASRPNGRLM